MSELENKEPQEESSGFLLIKMLIAFAVCGYGIYIMFK
jgi:hypothetical protein